MRHLERTALDSSKATETKTLDLPRDGVMTEIAQRLESAIKSDNIHYEVPKCGVRVLAAAGFLPSRQSRLIVWPLHVDRNQFFLPPDAALTAFRYNVPA